MKKIIKVLVFIYLFHSFLIAGDYQQLINVIHEKANISVPVINQDLLEDSDAVVFKFEIPTKITISMNYSVFEPFFEFEDLIERQNSFKEIHILSFLLFLTARQGDAISFLHLDEKNFEIEQKIDIAIGILKFMDMIAIDDKEIIESIKKKYR